MEQLDDALLLALMRNNMAVRYLFLFRIVGQLVKAYRYCVFFKRTKLKWIMYFGKKSVFLTIIFMVIASQEGHTAAKGSPPLCWWKPECKWIRPLVLADGSTEQILVLEIPKNKKIEGQPQVYYTVFPYKQDSVCAASSVESGVITPYFEHNQWKVRIRSGVPADVLVFSELTVSGRKQYAQAFFSMWAAANSTFIDSFADSLPNAWPRICLYRRGPNRPLLVSDSVDFLYLGDALGGELEFWLFDELHGIKQLEDSSSSLDVNASPACMLKLDQNKTPALLRYQFEQDELLNKLDNRMYKNMVLAVVENDVVATCSFQLARDSSVYVRENHGAMVLGGSTGLSLLLIAISRLRHSPSSRKKNYFQEYKRDH